MTKIPRAVGIIWHARQVDDELEQLVSIQEAVQLGWLPHDPYHERLSLDEWMQVRIL